MLSLISPAGRAEPFDHPDWLFEPAAADTARGWLISRNGIRMQQFEEVLDLLPKGYVSIANWSCWTMPGSLGSTSCCLGAAVQPTWLSTC